MANYIAVSEGVDTPYLEVTEGPLTGLQFIFGPISFLDEQDDGTVPVKYDYTLLGSPVEITDEIIPVLEKTLGDILEKILLDMSERGLELTPLEDGETPQDS
jgi:hypothetical protein